MDFVKELNALKAEKAQLAKEAEGYITNKDMGKLKETNGKLETINNSISEIEKTMKNSAEGAAPVEDGKKDGKSEKPFNSLGEQLKAIYDAKQKGVYDKRLDVVNAALGASSGVDADGGFAIQEDFAGNILETAAQSGEILKRVDKYTVSANSDTVKWVEIDETDIQSTVYGGVQTYWVEEAGELTQSKPKFKQKKLSLEKMAGLAYATSEVLEDVSFMSGLFGRSFSLACERLLEDAIIRGDGDGKPFGVLKSGALVTVPAESGQAAKTITAQNLLDMYTRAPFKKRANMVWLMHPDLEEQLPKMMLNDEPVWMPAGGISEKPYQTIFGRPVIFSDQCSEIGEVGDVLFIDFSEYILIRKGTERKEWSMHVQFLTDQMAFRIILRCNGMPKKEAPIKLKNSKLTRSPYVTLGART